MWTPCFTLMVLEAYSISSRVKWQQLLRFSLQNSWISWRLYRLSANDIVSFKQMSVGREHSTRQPIAFRVYLRERLQNTRRSQWSSRNVCVCGIRMCDVTSRTVRVTGWRRVYVWITAPLFSLSSILSLTPTFSVFPLFHFILPTLHDISQLSVRLCCLFSTIMIIKTFFLNKNRGHLQNF